MDHSTLQPDLRHPRPNPRFVGVERVLVVGVENLVQSISNGRVGLIVAGLNIIFLAVELWVPIIAPWFYGATDGGALPPSLEDADELESGALPTPDLPAPILPIQTSIVQ